MLDFFASAARFGSEMAGGVQHVTSSNRCINTSEIDYTAGVNSTKHQTRRAAYRRHRTHAPMDAYRHTLAPSVYSFSVATTVGHATRPCDGRWDNGEVVWDCGTMSMTESPSLGCTGA